MNLYLSLQKRRNQTKVFGVLNEPVGADGKKHYYGLMESFKYN